jgi:hypothetical protein
MSCFCLARSLRSHVSKADLSDAMESLQHLSDARAQKVLSLIQDLGEAEEPLPWEQVKARLDVQFGSRQPAG